MSVLDKIVAQKHLEIKHLYHTYALEELKSRVDKSADQPRFYPALAATKARQTPFFIAEFKRKSPSEGWINQTADLPAQVRAYAEAGAGAISILTDSDFFGGGYADLQLAADTLGRLAPTTYRPLLLQKDFILDPIQLYVAKLHGADIILLIAAILEPERLDFLRRMAESIGLGVLVEVHDAAELDAIQHLDFPVLGVNNRDLKTFRTALNRVNVLRKHAGGRFLIAESGIKTYRDFQVVREADGFLIGAGLMSSSFQAGKTNQDMLFTERFRASGTLLFKACGIRTPALLEHNAADFTGINFSAQSKRRFPELSAVPSFPGEKTVAVFYKNTEAEIRDILARFPFSLVQLYADDVSPAFIRSLKQKVLLACRVRETTDLQQLEAFASDVDLFILDGAVPGSGQRIGAAIPADFPYPFLLAGGLHADNLDLVLNYKNCIGVDIASGIETDGQVDSAKMNVIKNRLSSLFVFFTPT